MEYNHKIIISKLFLNIASIENIVHTLLQINTERVYCLCYCFADIFYERKKVSDNIRFDYTTIFQSNQIQEWNYSHIFFINLCRYLISINQSHKPRKYIESSTVSDKYDLTLKYFYKIKSTNGIILKTYILNNYCHYLFFIRTITQNQQIHQIESGKWQNKIQFKIFLIKLEPQMKFFS